MYTYNIFCFGHELSKDKELNNLLREWDIEFEEKIDKRIWEIDFPYHGGKVRGDISSCVFGTVITTDDRNPNYINIVRKAKEEDYIDDYNKFLNVVIARIEENVELREESELDFEELITKLKSFLKENKPKFYSVEVSS